MPPQRDTNKALPQVMEALSTVDSVVDTLVVSRPLMLTVIFEARRVRPPLPAVGEDKANP